MEADMENYHQLSQQRARIIEQIAALGPMRRGSVCDHYLPTKRKDGSVYRRGPYPTYTFKQDGKTRGKTLRNQQEAQLYREQIESFRRWQELSAELVRLSQRLADLEAAGQDGGKKNSSR
jgi:hypothetical protein